MKQGQSVTLTRVPNWWAKDKPFSVLCSCPAQIEFQVIRDEEKSFKIFLTSRNRHLRHEHVSEVLVRQGGRRPFQKGYIEKIQFCNGIPRYPTDCTSTGPIRCWTT
ncbi:MAG: hypothetical protein U1F77_05815 [Kiritimatiellia bacterium]